MKEVIGVLPKLDFLNFHEIGSVLREIPPDLQNPSDAFTDFGRHSLSNDSQTCGLQTPSERGEDRRPSG